MAALHALGQNRVLSVVTEGDVINDQKTTLPIIEGKIAIKGRATAYVCYLGVCQLPTTDVKTFKQQLN